MPLVSDVIVRDGRDAHRLVQRDGEWVLEGNIDGEWKTFWTSTLAPEHPVDFVLANHFTSTHPQSPFATMLLMSALTPDGRRVTVANRDVTIAKDGRAEKTQLVDRTALRRLLSEVFGIELPEVERMRVPTIPEWGS
jgi:N-hydroxyarylamine O-acetyltransferase